MTARSHLWDTLSPKTKTVDSIPSSVTNCPYLTHLHLNLWKCRLIKHPTCRAHDGAICSWMRTCRAGWGMWIGVLIKIFYFWLLWVFIAACSLSLVAASRGYFSLRYVGFSLRWLLLLGSPGSRYVGSVVVTHGLSCSVACGIFLAQVSNPCPLHWQADS